jgi:hypothetical protein
MKENKIIKLNVNKKKGFIKTFIENAKNQLFFLYYILLKHCNSNYYFELINIILQYLQILSYPLGKTVRKYLYNINNSLIQYFNQNKHFQK